ncbi:MAG: hypothetical protein IJP90_05640, partial [Treponema sp.]|nr:hypothetical protein [Treponema sp.]
RRGVATSAVMAGDSGGTAVSAAEKTFPKEAKGLEEALGVSVREDAILAQEVPMPVRAYTRQRSGPERLLTKSRTKKNTDFSG